MPQISPGDIVQVVVHDRPLTIGWANKTWKLTPDKPAFIPVEAALLWFGDPRSTGSSQALKMESGDVVIIPDREAEVRRLCIKYGYQTGNEHDFLQSDSVPKVAVTTLEDQQELPTVLTDPTGENVTQATQTLAEKDRLQQLIEAQQRQIDLLFRQVRLQGNASAEIPEDESVVTEDKSSFQPPTRSNTGPEIPPDFGLQDDSNGEDDPFRTS